MAVSSSSSSPILLYILISYLFLLASSSSSSSSSKYFNNYNKRKLVMFPLTHSLSTNSQFNTSTHLLLKSTSSRSAARFNNKKQQRRHAAVSALALSPGSDYTMSLSLGSQGSVVSVYMDTGSDTVWVPCSNTFTCIMCEGKSDDPLSPHNLSATASPVSCQSPACSAVHSGIPTSDLCAMARCPLESIEMSECNSSSCPAFYYAYGDGSFVARLYKDTLQMSSLMVKNFTFGCAHEALGEPIGVAGFGRGPLSLPAQLSPHHLDTQFSYCLISHSFDSYRVRQPSPLILGRRFDNTNNNNNSNKQQQGGLGNSTNPPTPLTDDDDDLAYTPMLENKKHPYYYYVGLEAITVGNKRIPAPENMKRIDRKGNGGMVVDSGTTYTMLPQQLYNSVVSQFRTSSSAVKFKRAASVEDRTGLSPCYYLPPNKVVIPQLLLHFGGNTSVVMPKRNYFYQFTDKKKKKSVAVGCMMLMNAGLFPDDSDSGGPGPAGLLGNYQQQGLEVVYDLLNKRIGFANRKCASLWEILQH